MDVGRKGASNRASVTVGALFLAFTSALCAPSVAYAQLARAFRAIPPVNRPMYIMTYGADSSAYAAFKRLSGDTVVFLGLAGSGRGRLTEMQLPLASVSRMEMAHLADWSTIAERSAIFGGLAGIAIGGGTAAIAGKSPGFPALLGGAAGTAAGFLLGGRSAKERVVCWQTVYQRDDADSLRLAELRRVRSPEPTCESIGRR